MKGFTRRLFIGLIVIILVLICCYWVFIIDEHDFLSKENSRKRSYVTNQTIKYREKVVIAVVSCEDRLQETLTMIKSALMFSEASLHFIVVAQRNHIPNFNEKLNDWKEHIDFSFRLFNLTFPSDSGVSWETLFKPCAAQRLFLPSVLKETDAIMYVDTDTLFLTPVENVWKHFKNMNSSQMAALAPEHEDPNVGWYNRFAGHPYYGKSGVNSGVMLMNLTKMRQFSWVDYMLPIYNKYRLKITWGDQDIINIIFHFHPDKLYVYPCKYNFRPDHCMYMSICKSAEKDGVEIVHGSRGFFHSAKQPIFQAIYEAFQEFQLGGDLYQGFYQPLDSYLQQYTDTKCGGFKDMFLKNIRKYIVNDTYVIR